MPQSDPALNVKAFGVILRTVHFAECTSFYRDKLGLPLWYEKQDIVCLRFGGGYLMIEKGGRARGRRKLVDESPSMLRFDVADVNAAADAMRSQGVPVEGRCQV